MQRGAARSSLAVASLETTKPSHFCEGFVLYGAAPGGVLDLKFMIINKISDNRSAFYL
jgi:hypothetical protein